MDFFPETINYSIGTDEDLYMPLLKTEFEANYQAVRATSTRDRKQFNLVIDWLTDEEYSTLEDFVKSHKAQQIKFLHTDHKTYTVVITTDKLNKKFAAPGYCHTALTLEQS